MPRMLMKKKKIFTIINALSPFFLACKNQLTELIRKKIYPNLEISIFNATKVPPIIAVIVPNQPK